MSDYPVMLYLGGLDSHAIAHDEDEADALKEQGYVEHDEAVKLEPEITELTDDDKDQLAEAYEHIERLEDAVSVKDDKILELNGELKAANERYEDKERELVEFQNSSEDTQEVADLKSKLAVYEETKDVNGDGVVSYDEMTNAELRKVLDQREVDHTSRDSKDALIQKLKDSE